jgi:hypothetical protein
VNLDNPGHLARVQRVFRAANEYHMAIVVHMHANIDHHRPNGAKEARIFLEQLLPEAPDVVVQIAHLGEVEASTTRQPTPLFRYL